MAVLAQDPVSAYAAGEVWHFFDQQLGYPVTLLHPDDLSRVDLGDYHVLVLPDGSYSQVLGDDLLKEVQAWVRSGGRLVALEGAAEFLAGKEGFSLKCNDDEPGGEDEAAEDETLLS